MAKIEEALGEYVTAVETLQRVVPIFGMPDNPVRQLVRSTATVQDLFDLAVALNDFVPVIGKNVHVMFNSQLNSVTDQLYHLIQDYQSSGNDRDLESNKRRIVSALMQGVSYIQDATRWFVNWQQQTSADLQHQCEVARRTESRLEALLTSAQQDALAAATHSEGLTETNSRLQADVTRANRTIMQLEETMATQAHTAEQSRQRTEERNASLANEIKQLREKMSRTMDEHNAMKHSMSLETSAKEHLSRELRNSRKEVSDLRDQIIKADDRFRDDVSGKVGPAYDEIRQLKETNSRLQADVTRANRTIMQLEETMATQAHTAEQSRQRTEERNASLENEIKQLREKMSHTKVEHNAMKHSMSLETSAKEHLSRELRNSRKEVSDLRDQIIKADDRFRDDVSGKVGPAYDEIRQLKETNSQLQADLSRSAEQIRELSELNEDQIRVADRLRHRNEERSISFISEIQQLEETNRQLQADLSRATKGIEQQEETRLAQALTTEQTRQRTEERVLNETRQLKETIRLMEEAAQRENTVLQQHLRKTNQSVSDADNRMKALEAENARMNTENVLMRKELGDAKRAIDEYSRQMISEKESFANATSRHARSDEQLRQQLVEVSGKYQQLLGAAETICNTYVPAMDEYSDTGLPLRIYNTDDIGTKLAAVFRSQSAEIELCKANEMAFCMRLIDMFQTATGQRVRGFSDAIRNPMEYLAEHIPLLLNVRPNVGNEIGNLVQEGGNSAATVRQDSPNGSRRDQVGVKHKHPPGILDRVRRDNAGHIQRAEKRIESLLKQRYRDRIE